MQQCKPQARSVSRYWQKVGTLVVDSRFKFNFYVLYPEVDTGDLGNFCLNFEKI